MSKKRRRHWSFYRFLTSKIKYHQLLYKNVSKFWQRMLDKWMIGQFTGLLNSYLRPCTHKHALLSLPQQNTFSNSFPKTMVNQSSQFCTKLLNFAINLKWIMNSLQNTSKTTQNVSILCSLKEKSVNKHSWKQLQVETVAAISHKK